MKLYWIVHKDLVTEWRSGQAWPAMLVLALVVGFLFVLQSDSPAEEGLSDAARQIWLATYFAGVVALNRSFDVEQEGDCWGGLLLYPVSPSAIYAGKLAGNVLALGVVQLVLAVFFGLVHGPSFFRYPLHLMAVFSLGNLGMASVGTVIASLSIEGHRGTGLVGVLVLPLVAPVLLVASESTRLLLSGSIDGTWWDGFALLAAFAAAFCTIGFALSCLLFEE